MAKRYKKRGITVKDVNIIGEKWKKIRGNSVTSTEFMEMETKNRSGGRIPIKD